MSSEFIELAKRIAKRDSHVFEALQEFERTKRIRTKERMNFTVDKGVASKFKEMCEKNGYNMSAKIEKAMQMMVKENEGNYR
jgi:hypothetical protein